MWLVSQSLWSTRRHNNRVSHAQIQTAATAVSARQHHATLDNTVSQPTATVRKTTSDRTRAVVAVPTVSARAARRVPIVDVPKPPSRIMTKNTIFALLGRRNSNLLQADSSYNCQIWHAVGQSIGAHALK